MRASTLCNIQISHRGRTWTTAALLLAVLALAGCEALPLWGEPWPTEPVDIRAGYVAPAQPFRTTVADLEHSFINANPDFDVDVLAVYCSGSGRFLQQLYVCFSLDGRPTACSAEILKRETRSCPSSFLVRNVR